MQRSWTRWTLTLLTRRHRRLLVKQHRLEIRVQEVERRLYRLNPPPLLEIPAHPQLTRLQQLEQLELQMRPVVRQYLVQLEAEQKPTSKTPPGNDPS